MKKCEFCRYSAPDGTCYWNSGAIRKQWCEIAINLMIKTLGGRAK